MDSSELHFFAPRGVLKVSGEDAATFLQGQFSQDLRIKDGEVAYGLWLSRKGKILADSFVGRVSDDEFWVISYFGDSALLKDNLDARIIMDEVEVEIPQDEWRGVSLWGDGVEASLEPLGLSLPAKGGFSADNGVIAFWGRSGGKRSLDVLAANEESFGKLEFALGAQVSLSPEEVSIRSIEGRRFEVGHDATSDDLPQEVGLGEIAVSYSKGCYIGQEVMARLSSMGKSRRSLLPVLLSVMLEGEGPWAVVDEKGKKAGEVRRCFEADGRIIGSAMIKASALDSRSLSLAGMPDVQATVVDSSE
jgi:folate-binding protein YgfZ